MERARIMIRKLWRSLAPPSGAGTRKAVGTLCVLFGIGRMGLLSYSTVTYLPAIIWGIVMLSLGGLLLVTNGSRRLSVFGRMVASVGCAVLGGLAYDVWPAHTSALILYYLAYMLFGQAGAQHDH